MIAISLSGGMDSAVLLAICLNAGQKVLPVFFEYGSRHNRYERDAARAIAKFYNITTLTEVVLTDVSNHLRSSLLLHGDLIPRGHYANEEMKKTVVPARNLIFISILAGLAESRDCDEIGIGIHAGDDGTASLYPDCRPEFLESAKETVRLATDGKIVLYAPFVYKTKFAILQEGLRYEVPFYLTRTCYENQEVACGQCSACQKRLWAYASAGVMDPLTYVSRELIDPS